MQEEQFCLDSWFDCGEVGDEHERPWYFHSPGAAETSDTIGQTATTTISNTTLNTTLLYSHPSLHEITTSHNDIGIVKANELHGIHVTTECHFGSPGLSIQHGNLQPQLVHFIWHHPVPFEIYVQQSHHQQRSQRSTRDCPQRPHHRETGYRSQSRHHWSIRNLSPAAIQKCAG